MVNTLIQLNLITLNNIQKKNMIAMINNMVSLLPPDGILCNSATTAPSPSKDYCQILVQDGQVRFLFIISNTFNSLL